MKVSLLLASSLLPSSRYIEELSLLSKSFEQLVVAPCKKLDRNIRLVTRLSYVTKVATKKTVTISL